MLASIFKSVDRYDVVKYAEASLLQMFLRERFLTLSPKMIEFKPLSMKKLSLMGWRRRKPLTTSLEGWDGLGKARRGDEGSEQSDRRREELQLPTLLRHLVRS